MLIQLREGPAPLIRRQDYAQPAYWIRHAELTFDLDGAKTIVASKLAIARNGSQPRGPLVLHGDGLNLLRVMADGQSVSFRHGDDGSLVIDEPPAADAFTLEIRNTCCPDKNTELSGLYTSGSGLFTQCEAEGFRRITYFLDRPDVMATYRVTLRADKARYPVLLANGNLVEQGELDHGRHFAVWHDPFPKPSYLFAVVAGKLSVRRQQIRTRSGREHLLEIYTAREDLDKTEHAMASLIASIVWDEQRFGLALDLERFMIVAVGDYNMGAMENKGLNLFNTQYVLASPATATDADYEAIESVVGHEYFHNWTGNRITCRDWFQLSLKEGLTVYRDQEFSMDMAGSPAAETGAPSPVSARAVKRIADVKRLRALQFPEDAGAMAHPVRPDAYIEINNFYTPTVYEKGAEVVRMMATLVGREGFRRGMDLYFQRHDGQAVTCDDFAQAIADANPGSALGKQLDAFKRWYSQAGTPHVTARGRYDAHSRSYTLGFEQRGMPTPGQPDKLPFVIPMAVGLVSRDGRAIALQLEDEPRPMPGREVFERVLVLDEAKSFFTFVGVDSEPVPSLLRGFSAPVILTEPLSDDDLLVLLSHDGDAFNRWEAGQRLALNRLLGAIKGEREPLLDTPFIEAMRGVLRHPDLDAAFKCLVLTLPDESLLAEQLDSVNPQRIHAVREVMLGQLAQALRDDWVWAFDAHQVGGAYTPDPVSAGKRSLANLALAMLCLDAAKSGDTVWPGRAYQRVKDAGNMTDRSGALMALVDSHAGLADRALALFHARFRHEPLVIDKWFALQARMPERADGRAFARVKQLLSHPDFSLKNPNRARSLIQSFCAGNPAAFHRSDAAGYVFWSDAVREIDGFNSQISSRIARVMDRWNHLAEPYRSAAREAIARVAAKPDLSAGVREILDRALASG
jgi:aminopeptidase N